MYQAAPMDLADCCGQADGDAQECESDRATAPGRAQEPDPGAHARVTKDRSPPATSERQRLGCPHGIKLRCERVFVLKPPEALRRRLLWGECDRQDRGWAAALSAAVKGELRAFPQGLQHLPERLGH
jgi:hypothetical protein